MAEFDCKKCLHEKVCALWASRESQDASCFCTDGCDYFTPTLTPPNEPLTCEELREMDGEAIYWPKNKMWLIVYLNHPDFGDCAVNREGQYLQLEKCEKQKVYRRQPEGEEDT